MKKLVISMLFVLQVVFAWAQERTSSVTGKVVDSKTQKPLESVVATIQNTTLTALTNSEGVFVFENVVVGNQLLEVNSNGYARQLLSINVTEGTVLDLGSIMFEEDITSEQQLSLITITENDLGDDNSGSESTAGLLQATRDAYQQAAAFNWGQARFRIRGLDNEYGKTMINGVSMDKIYDGRPQYSNWGGLNDATRNQEFTNGSTPSDYTFGGPLGTQEINTRASIYRPGTRISFSGTNTNYNFRTMATHASGMDQNGWAYVISASRRWAEEGYFEGTDYAANSFFASVEKRISENHSLNITSIYAQNSRGKNSPNTKEVTDLMGTEYNSYWGYQNGKKRNSRDKDVEEPIFILSHYWKINDKTNLNTSVSYQFGSIANSRFDFNNANNPDPVYYRNLPSYKLFNFLDNGNTFDTEADRNAFIAENEQWFKNNSQIDWNKIYESNAISGISQTVLYEDRTDDKVFSANSYLMSQLSNNIILNAGVNYRKLKSNNYQKLIDLLGGTSFRDYDRFLTGDAQQTDLNNPDRYVTEGDKYGYNYNLFADVVDAFTQFKFTYNKVDFYLAQNFSRSAYQREGLYRNGNYPTNSYGKGEMINFENFGFKGGLTYKITGRHFLDFNGLYMTKAPTLRNTFYNARMNNETTADLTSERIVSADASYIIRMPKFKARLSGFFSKVSDATDISFYFAEGLSVISEEENTSIGGNAFVAEIMSGINRRNIGGEFGAEYQVTSTIKVTGAASYGQYVYDNNPNIKLSIDNQAKVFDYGSAKLKNYKVASAPQSAYSIGIEYRDPKFWWIGVNANYLDNNYSDISGILRTDNFVKNSDDIDGFPIADATEENVRKILKQEKFDPVRLVNLTGGKSWRVSNANRNTIGFFASVNNLFDLTYKTGGFEQARNANYTQLAEDRANGNTFGSKYFYGYGRTYFVNVYFNF